MDRAHGPTRGSASGPAVAGSQAHPDAGFTLVELLVVAVILGVLLAIAVPSFQTAQRRAADRKAMAHVRQTYVSQLTHASDAQAFTDDVTTLQAVDGALAYTTDLTTMAAVPVAPRLVYVEVSTATTADDTVLVGARSTGGDCFWLRATLSTPVSFATNDCAGPPTAAQLTTRW